MCAEDVVLELDRLEAADLGKGHAVVPGQATAPAVQAPGSGVVLDAQPELGVLTCHKDIIIRGRQVVMLSFLP